MSSTTAAAIRPDLIRQLDSDWKSRFADRQHDFAGIGVRTCGELHLELRATRGPENDQLMHALLSAARAGDELAERVLLRQMTPSAFARARNCRSLRRLSPTDAFASALSATWEAIRLWNLAKTDNIHANLSMNALHIITNQLDGKAGAELPTDFNTLEEFVQPDDHDSITPAWGDDTDRDLVEVLRWAIENDTLTADEVRILARYDLGLATDRDSLADDLGIARDSLNRRVLRIRNKLIEAIRRHVAVNGAW